VPQQKKKERLPTDPIYSDPNDVPPGTPIYQSDFSPRKVWMQPISEVMPKGMKVPMVVPGDMVSARNPEHTLAFHDPETRTIVVRPEILRRGAYLASDPPINADQALGHELGHSIWHQLPDEMKDHYVSTLDRGSRLPSSRLPRETMRYSNDPAHSFADFTGAYMSNPNDLRQRAVTMHDIMKQIMEQDYSPNRNSAIETMKRILRSK
jgi:hypothetical protein